MPKDYPKQTFPILSDRCRNSITALSLFGLSSSACHDSREQLNAVIQDASQIQVDEQYPVTDNQPYQVTQDDPVEHVAVRTEMADRMKLHPDTKPDLRDYLERVQRGEMTWTSNEDEVETVPSKGLILSTLMEGNGMRDVVVYMPKYDPSKPFALIMHSHGSHGQHILEGLPTDLGKNRYGAKIPEGEYHRHHRHQFKKYIGTPKQIGATRLSQAMLATNELATDEGKFNVVLVYPLAKGGRGRCERKGQDGLWFNSMEVDENFDQTVHETAEMLNEELGIDNFMEQLEYVVSEGHSAGGMFMGNVAKTHAAQISVAQKIESEPRARFTEKELVLEQYQIDYAPVKIDAHVYLDANYAGWDASKEMLEVNPETRVEYVVVNHNNNHRRARKKTKAEGKFLTVSDYKHGECNRNYLGGEEFDQLQGSPLKKRREKAKAEKEKEL